MGNHRAVALIGAVVCAISLFLDWSVDNVLGTITTAGIETGDGPILLGTLAVGAAIVWFNGPSAGTRAVCAFASIIGAAYGIVQISKVQDAVDQFALNNTFGAGGAGVGVGLYLWTVGAVIVGFAAFAPT